MSGDAVAVACLTRRMVEAMERSGGRAVRRDDGAWSRFAREVDARLARPEHLYLLGDGGVEALGHAHITELAGVFEPLRVLHVSAVFVGEAHRGRGVGASVVRALLDWGCAEGCAEATLHVLAASPARRLYEALGFAPHELTMRRPLTP